jgi:hypothetical protein
LAVAEITNGQVWPITLEALAQAVQKSGTPPSQAHQSQIRWLLKQYHRRKVSPPAAAQVFKALLSHV